MQINQGAFFAHAGESDYALLRRFLLANYGIPFATLMRGLAEQTEPNDPHRHVDHLRRLHQLADTPVSRVWHPYDRPPRQSCPDCQHQLFHSDLFDLPTLIRCPHHDRPLTPRCTTCHQPWPSLGELPHRACRECGVFPFDQLCAGHGFSVEDTAHVTLSALARLLANPLKDVTLCGQSISGAPDFRYSLREWCAPHYLAYVIAWWSSQANENKPELPQLAGFIRDESYRHFTAPVTPLSAIDPGTLDYPDLIASRFYVLRRLISSIDHHSNAPHGLIPHLPPDHFELYPFHLRCPMCLALTLWLMQNVGFPLPVRQRMDIPSLAPWGYMVSENVFQPITITHLVTQDGQPYVLPKNFVLWWYERELEYQFVELLQIATMLVNITSDTPHADHSCFEQIDALRACYDDRLILLEEQELHCYYPSETSLAQAMKLFQRHNEPPCQACQPPSTALFPSAPLPCATFRELNTLDAYQRFEAHFERCWTAHPAEENVIGLWYQVFLERARATPV